MPHRTIKKVYPALRDDIEGLVTRRALPTRLIEHIDPFLFLNHHGPQTYPRRNHGLPFGPHPHRGFETVTFILKGDIAHRDSAGHESVIRDGGIQWMTAGRGLVHSELSSEEFKRSGGELEILQLWVNLPARLKLTEPRYIGLQKNEIPTVAIDESRVSVQLVSGEWDRRQGPVPSLAGVTMTTLLLAPEGHLELHAPVEHNVFFYVVRGEVHVAGRDVTEFHLVEFENNGELIEVKAKKESVVLYGHAKPFNEPVVAHGPFVMNTRDEIVDAIRDFQAGKFA